MLKSLLRFPYPEVSLFFEAEKLGVISMLMFNRRGLNMEEWTLVKGALCTIQYNSFCTLQMIKGEACKTCSILLSGAFPIEYEEEADLLFGRCRNNVAVRQVTKLVKTRNNNQLWQIRELVREKLANFSNLGWDKLIRSVRKEIKLLRPKEEK